MSGIFPTIRPMSGPLLAAGKVPTATGPNQDTLTAPLRSPSLQLSTPPASFDAGLFGQVEEIYRKHHSTLKADNPIHAVIRLEAAAQHAELADVREAYQILGEIHREVHAEQDADRTPKAQIELFYQVLNDRGMLGNKGEQRDCSLAKNLIEGSLDCDDQMHVVVALAHEWQLPVRPVWLREHTVARYDDGNEAYNFYLGEIKTDEELARYGRQNIQGLNDQQFEALLWFNIGICALDHDDVEAAIPYLEKAHQLFPEEAQILTNLAVCHQKLEHYDEAMRLLEAAFLLDPEDADIIVLQANNYEQLGDNAQALQILEAAVLTMGNDPRLLHHRGRLEVIADNLDKAEGLLLTARMGYDSSNLGDENLDRDRRAEVSYFLGAIEYERGDHEEALSWLEEAIFLNGAYPQALFLSGVVRLRLGDSGGAALDLEEALTLDKELVTPAMTDELWALLKKPQEQG